MTCSNSIENENVCVSVSRRPSECLFFWYLYIEVPPLYRDVGVRLILVKSLCIELRFNELHAFTAIITEFTYFIDFSSHHAAESKCYPLVLRH